MNKTFDQGKHDIASLCRYFETNRNAFLASGVKEAHVRQSLIDPLFEALEWDVGNTAMAAPQYREVIPEDSLDVRRSPKGTGLCVPRWDPSEVFGEAKNCGAIICGGRRPCVPTSELWMERQGRTFYFNRFRGARRL